MQKSRIRKEEFDGLLGPTEVYGVCVWPVAERYRVFGERIYPDDSCDWDLIVPLEDPDLFLSFARLCVRGAPSEKSVLRWVSRFGLLFREDEDQPAWSVDEAMGPVYNQAPIRLKDFVHHAERATDLLRLYGELETRDKNAIRARAAKPVSEIDKRLSARLKSTPLRNAYQKAYEELSGRPGHEVDLHSATEVLAEELTAALSSVKLKMDVVDSIQGLVYYSGEEERSVFHEPPYRLGRTWHCPDLFSAIFLQFYLMATKHKPLKRCDNPACGLLFPATRKDKRYCNATCRSNARNYK